VLHGDVTDLVYVSAEGRALGHRHAPIFDQSHRLKLELAAERPSLHSHSPVPSNTLSRCPRNWQQAKTLEMTTAKARWRVYARRWTPLPKPGSGGPYKKKAA